MNAAVAETVVKPSSAIAAVLTHDGPVMLDFDETLYLRNSTEDFIDSARPGLLALLLIRFLDAIKPWRWTGGIATRDVWRVRCVLALLPWTKTHWLKRVHSLAVSHANAPLIAAIQRRVQAENGPTYITTLGFDFIVAPLAAALGLGRVRVIACRANTTADRREGKLRVITGAVGNEAVRRALVLTDSRQDEPLLDACAVPLRIEWPQARYRSAFKDRYLPGQYLSVVKRPGERYIARGILQEDFALWVLTSVALAAQPIAHIAALCFLLASFWAIYETGYVDNDRIASRFEQDPKLSGAFRDAPVVTPRVQPWLWALGCGAVGVLLLRGVTTAAAVGFAAWTVVLACTSGAFMLYNRFDKNTRIWWYCGLQLARSAAFIVLVPIHMVGAMAIGAHVMAKWVPYYIYRSAGKNWPDHTHFLTRLLFFVLLLVLVAVVEGIGSILTISTAALLAWNVFRARHQLMEVWLDARRLDKGAPERPAPPKSTVERRTEAPQ